MGRHAIAFQLDATNSEQVNTVVAQAAQSLGGHTDILMNNAGHLVGRSSIADMTDDRWFKTINVNLTSTFFAPVPYCLT
jgi:3-oxoacyl-[acyl-carrier protein] reductase